MGACPLCVVIPAYNAAGLIGATLDSLYTQTTDDFEIIVVDDGSTDETTAIIQDYQARYARPVLHLIQQSQQGPSAARNRAIAATDAPLVGFLDADDLWAPDKARRHIALMEERPDVLLSFSGFHYVDETGASLNQVQLPEAGELTHRTLLLRNVIHTSTVIARRAALQAEGGFDESLKTYEDFDLWLKLAAHGPSAIRAIPEDMAAYRRHSEQATRRWEAMHAGWHKVIARQKAAHPDAWAAVGQKAEGFQYEYCAALAYNAGDNPAARRLILRCWRAGGLRMLGQPEVRLMTAICAATYLPRRFQIWLGRIYSKLRQWRNGARAEARS